MKDGSVCNMSNKHPNTLNLFLTGRCNLDCKYCFVNKSGHEKSILKEADMKKTIDIFLGYPGKSKTIGFSGGEPTIEFELLRRVCDYALRRAKKAGKRLDIAVVTNGTLLDQRMVDFFRTRRILVRVSIDGEEETHDQKRSSRAGSASHSKIMKNLSALKDLDKLQLTASMVFAPDNLQYLMRNIRFINRLNFSAIDFYPDLYAEWQERDLQRFEKVMAEFSLYYSRLFLENSPKIFKNSLIDSIVNGTRISKLASCSKMNLGFDGRFYACDKGLSLDNEARDKYAIGSVAQGADIRKKDALLQELEAAFLVESGLQCRGCRFYDYCFCPAGHIIHYAGRKNKKKLWRSFCRLSMTFNKNFFVLVEHIGKNERFWKVYRR